MKALALVEARDHVCCRYRISAFEPSLAAAGWSLAIEPLASGLFARLRQFARAAEFDTVVLQRKLLPRWQIGSLRRHARRLIFDFDDAVLYRDSYDPRGPHHHRRLDRFGKTVRAADAVIAGNDFLASCARDTGARPERVRVIPTCVQTATSILASPTDRPPTGSRLDLVWIGSSSTMAGLEQRRSLWERIGREVPGVRLRMICDRFLRFDSLPVVEIPWALATEDVEVAAGDLGISLVPDDLWSRGKCGLKILQYQAAGLPVLANPVGVHRELIRPGISGFLPRTDDDWVEAVATLADDADLRRALGSAGRQSVEANHAVNAWASAFVGAIAGTRSMTSSPHLRTIAANRPKIEAASDR